MVDHFGLGHQQPSPSRAPSPNARVRPYCLAYSPPSLALAAQVSHAKPRQPNSSLVSSVHSRSMPSFLSTPPKVARSATLQFRYSRPPTSCIVPTLSVSDKMDTLHRALPRLLSARTFVTSQLSRNVHCAFNDKLRNSSRPAALTPTTGQKGEETAKPSVRVLPGAHVGHARRHDTQCIALWHPSTRQIRSRSHRSHFSNVPPPTKSCLTFIWRAIPRHSA